MSSPLCQSPPLFSGNAIVNLFQGIRCDLGAKIDTVPDSQSSEKRQLLTTGDVQLKKAGRAANQSLGNDLDFTILTAGAEASHVFN